MEEETETKQVRKFKINFFVLTLVVLALAGIGASGFFFYKYQGANKLLKNTTGVSAEESKNITDKVSKFYNLPQDETPNVATVLDVSKLTDQPFFKDAKNDDKVLIYAKAGIAILYRPSENKIINVSPVSGIPSPTPTSEQEKEPTQKPAVEQSSEPPL